MRTIDRIFGWLMVLAALQHSVGAWSAYRSQHELLFWALASGLAEFYLAGMNLIRAERRHDLALARLCVAGNLTWLVVILFFAGVVSHFSDPRVLVQCAITGTLLLLSMRARNRSRPM
jgi:hypothetical protein